MMAGPNPNWLPSASSIHNGNTVSYGANLAIDGIEVEANFGFWHNNEMTDFGWFQLDLGEEYYIKAVNISNRRDSAGAFLFQEAYKEVPVYIFHNHLIALVLYQVLNI